MKVISKKIVQEDHILEFGISTWDSDSYSIRNRYNFANGRFNRASSQEIPVEVLEDLVRFSVDEGALSAEFLKSLIKYQKV